MTKSDALKLEYRVKQVPASRKYLELTKEENKMTKKLKKDLQTVNKELKALAKKTESLLKAFDKLEKPKAKPSKAKAVKKPPAKKVAPKKAAPATAADTVFAIIKRYKKGVDTKTLMQKTGYEKKKISNLFYKLKKEGKIKSVGKGVYLKA
jgi:predicted Rossmann fold nucleotide-binding protein DprA/Smf involved in DNA uptake